MWDSSQVITLRFHLYIFIFLAKAYFLPPFLFMGGGGYKGIPFLKNIKNKTKETTSQTKELLWVPGHQKWSLTSALAQRQKVWGMGNSFFSWRRGSTARLPFWEDSGIQSSWPPGKTLSSCQDPRASPVQLTSHCGNLKDMTAKLHNRDEWQLSFGSAGSEEGWAAEYKGRH